MKSDNWLELPMIWSGIYPKDVVDLAERAGVPVEEVAAKKGIKPGVVANDFIRRDDVELIYRISQDPENDARTILHYITGEFDVVVMNAEKVVKKIDRFLGPDGYVFHKRTLMQINPEEDEEEPAEED